MASYDPFLQIAAAHNNTGGLTAIEDALTTDSVAKATVQSWGNFSLGEKRFRADGTLYHVGFPSTTWIFSIMSFTQYEAIQNTYCGAYGAFSGLVTIKTNTVRATTYGNYNATLLLPHPNELQKSPSLKYYLNVPIRFIHMVGL